MDLHGPERCHPIQDVGPRTRVAVLGAGMDSVPAQVTRDHDAVVGQPGEHVTVGVTTAIGQQLHASLTLDDQAVLEQDVGEGDAETGGRHLRCSTPKIRRFAMLRSSASSDSSFLRRAAR